MSADILENQFFVCIGSDIFNTDLLILVLEVPTE
jgi:hypothetical protein